MTVAYKNYQDLKIWNQSMDNAVLIYSMTEKFPKDEKYGVISQMRRAATSIPANIAEGYVRKGNELQHFLSIALGSSAELETFLLLSLRLGYIKENIASDALDKIQTVGKMITNFRKSLVHLS
jgi:four helix bundle protein